MWDSLFGLANLWALVCWVALIMLPRGAFVQSAILYGGIGLLCLAYLVLLALVISGRVDVGVVDGGSAADFTTIAGVRGMFMSDGGVTVGWIHYLALDLFAGLWIARDADQKSFSRWVQAPVLLFTFFAGPAGLLAWLVIREKRARKGARKAA